MYDAVTLSSEAASPRLVHAHADLTALGRTGPSVLVAGDGVHVRDRNGRVLVDALSGMWCVGLGYNDPGLIEAARAQLSRLAYCPIFGERTSDVAIDLAEDLVAMAPAGLEHVFFVNSGSEANDTALKIAWYVANARGEPQRKTVLTFDRAYHGSTIGAAGLTALPHMHRGFDLPLSRVVRVPAPDARRLRREGEEDAAWVARLLAEIEDTILSEGPETICAFFAEPVLGAGGVVVPPPGFYPRLQAMLKRWGILLVADEIITGFGRTGSMFGCETFGFTPDMMTLAKNLSSGYLPIGAIMISPAIYETITAESGAIGTFACGMTYSGHPAACAVARACLARYAEPGFLPRVRELGAHLGRRLLEATRDHPDVLDVRGIGLLGAVDLRSEPAPTGATGSLAPAGVRGKQLVAAGLERGVVLRALGDTIVFCPPFVSTEADIDAMVERFAAALADVAGQPRLRTAAAAGA